MTEIIKDRNLNAHILTAYEQELVSLRDKTLEMAGIVESHYTCLLYTSDAADD